jgi:hypothetical protein
LRWIWYRNARVRLAEGVYDLRASIALLARKHARMEYAYITAAWKAAFSGVPHRLVQRKQLTPLWLVPIAKADRRHLTDEQRWEVAVALRQEGHSYRAIGGALGASHVTIMEDVRKAESPGDQSPGEQPTRITGFDGQSCPASRPKPDRTAEHAAAVEQYPAQDLRLSCVRTPASRRKGAARSLLRKAVAEGVVAEEGHNTDVAAEAL